MMGYLTWTLALVITGVCCVNHQVWQVGYNVNRQDIVKADGTEDRHDQASCEWTSPPEDGFNFRPCYVGLCSGLVGSHVRNGTLRFTRCDRRYVLIEGSDKDTCVDGKWTSGGHQCIPCGRSQVTFNPLEDSDRIIEGHISSRGDFPWMAAIYNPLEGDDWQQICGGTLISPSLVLTAAHCMVFRERNFEPEDVRVGLGKLYSDFYRQKSSSIISTVKEIVRPERYIGVDHLFDLDIALLVLNNSVATGDYIMPACMDWGATMEPKHNEVGYLAGWGKTEQGTASDVLKWATQRFVQYDDCKTLMAPTDRRLVTQDKFCAAEVKGGKADKGDSGGGLTMLRDGAHHVYGVLSTKLSLHDQNVRLFTDVLNSGHLDWLRQHWQRLLLNQPYKKPAESMVEEPVMTSSVSKTKSEEMCKKYAEFVYVTIPDGKGSQDRYDTCSAVEPLIVNGEDAMPREYPHMALIGYGSENATRWLCGGSLISERFVLSAGSCSNSRIDPAKWVLLGEYNKESTADEEQLLSKPTRYEIIESITHPDYKDNSFYNNIALFRLNKDVEFNEYIRPICLHTEYEIPKTYAIATGWGRIKSGARYSDVLQKVNLTITTEKVCEDAYHKVTLSRLKDGLRHDSMLCAGDSISAKDTCQGDSGGPLQLRLSDPYCMYSQIGITSFGAGCKADPPTVYTRVSHFAPWIESIVWP